MSPSILLPVTTYALLALVILTLAPSAGAQQLSNYTPGSYINVFSSMETSKTYVVLSDGATGRNYTTVLGVNLSVSGPLLVYPEDRLIVFQVSFPDFSTGFAFYEYSPRSAPRPSKRYPSCVLPETSPLSLSQPFLLNGNVYAGSGTSIYKVQLPSVAGGPCNATLNAVIKHSMFAVMGIARAQRNLFTFTTRTSIVQLAASDDGTVFETFGAAHNLNRLPPAYYMIDVDWSTSKLYITIQNNDPSNQTAFVGTITGPSAVVLEPLPQWSCTITDNTLYSVDWRYAGDVGPLLCGVDFFGQHCNLASNGTDVVWQGPALPSLGSGSGPETVYDFQCQ